MNKFFDNDTLFLLDEKDAKNPIKKLVVRLLNKYFLPILSECEKSSANQIEILEDRLNEQNKKLDAYERLFKEIPNIQKNLQNNNNILGILEECFNTLSEAMNKPDTKVYDEVDYFDFENHFRGSEELIKQRQSIYLPYYQDYVRVLDLGCGRGEFLDLLRENGISATGVDFYGEFVSYCRKKELNVQLDDAISFLENTRENATVFLRDKSWSISA